MKSTRLFPLSFLLFTLLLTSCSPAVVPVVAAAKSGEILYQEEFEKNTTGWDRVANDHGIMDYDGGGYRMLIKQAGYNMWSTAEKNFGDVRVEADVFRLSGPDENRQGLICRYQNGDYYFFVISNDGYYAIGKFIGQKTLLLGQTTMQQSDLIKKEAVNHLRADCIADTLTFYINFKQAASVKDSDFKNGDVGLLAGAFKQPGVDVLFDHFVVLQP